MNEHFVDHDVGEVICEGPVVRAGISVHIIAGLPGFDAVFTVVRTRHHQRVPRTVCRRGPWVIVGILDILQDRVYLVSEALGPSAIGQITGIRPHNPRDSVERLGNGRIGRHHQVRPPRQDCSLGENEVNLAGQLISAQVIGYFFTVVYLDKLKIVRIDSANSVGIERIVHDLRDDQSAHTAGRIELAIVHHGAGRCSRR